VTDVNWN